MMQDIAGELERVHERMHALAYSRYQLRKIPKMYIMVTTSITMRIYLHGHYMCTRAHKNRQLEEEHVTT